MKYLVKFLDKDKNLINCKEVETVVQTSAVPVGSGSNHVFLLFP